MTKPSLRADRRGPGRPAVGDWKPCPTCATGMLLFTEQYRARTSSPAPATEMPAKPAWVCDQSMNVTFVRSVHRPRSRPAKAKTIRAMANRRIIKARFVRHRANKALQKSLSKKKTP